MTVIQFLSDYAQLFLTRAAKEGMAITALYTQTAAEVSGVKNAVVSTLTLTGPNGGALEVSVGFPLQGELRESYKPVLEDEQWNLFLLQELRPETQTIQ